MKKTLACFLFIALFLFTTVTASVARSRHYGSSHHYGSHHSSYRSFSSRYHNHSSDHFWVQLGAGLLTGAILGSIFYHPPRQKTVIYTRPQQIYTTAVPVYVNPSPTYSSQQAPVYVPPPELILRRVTTTPVLLNIRSGPGLDTPITGQVTGGTVLDVIGAAPEWLYIKTGSGNYGWIMTQYTQNAQEPLG